MKLIPNWQRENLRCYFCGDTRSVKYELEIHGFTGNFPKVVCACNKCALSRNKREVLDTVSTLDVVEVVRCKNCRLSEEMEGLIGGTCLYCTHWNHDVDPTGFCSEGV